METSKEPSGSFFVPFVLKRTMKIVYLAELSIDC